MLLSSIHVLSCLPVVLPAGRPLPRRPAPPCLALDEGAVDTGGRGRISMPISCLMLSCLHTRVTAVLSRALSLPPLARRWPGGGPGGFALHPGVHDDERGLDAKARKYLMSGVMVRYVEKGGLQLNQDGPCGGRGGCCFSMTRGCHPRHITSQSCADMCNPAYSVILMR